MRASGLPLPPGEGRGGGPEAPHEAAAQRGFTLPELVAVLVLIGVLAAVALPRLADTSGFAARGAADALAATLRYAQQTAVGMRRNVCVRIDAATMRIEYASQAGSDSSCNRVLLDPSTGAAYEARAYADGRASVATPTAVVFDGLGRPLSQPGVALAAPIAITVSGHATPITIEPETGIVH